MINKNENKKEGGGEYQKWYLIYWGIFVQTEFEPSFSAPIFGIIEDTKTLKQ